MTTHPIAPPSTTSGSAALRSDVVSGLTAAAVVLPKAMAYATVAGLPVAVGLYTAFVPMIVYALLGSSRVLSVSSTTTLAILAGTQLGLVVPDGDPAKLVTATATLAALVGVALLLARVLRLGFVSNFISSPVLTGFKTGIGLVIVLDQVPKLFGIHITKAGFFRDILSRRASPARDLAPDARGGGGHLRACSSAWSASGRTRRRRSSRSAAASRPRGTSGCRPAACRSSA